MPVLGVGVLAGMGGVWSRTLGWASLLLALALLALAVASEAGDRAT